MAGETDRIKGNIKEAEGKLTDDPSREAEGKTDQAKGKMKEAWDDTKDAAKDMKR
jgi:uncharacterized protein YjbJ (UPF0337 family)